MSRQIEVFYDNQCVTACKKLDVEDRRMKRVKFQIQQRQLRLPSQRAGEEAYNQSSMFINMQRVTKHLLNEKRI